MQFKTGDKVKITRRDGEGKTGVITKVSDVDPKFKYCVKTKYDEYWKEEASLEPAEETVSVKPSSTTAAQKKRGRPKGSAAKVQAKPKKKEPAEETEKVALVTTGQKKELFDQYRDFLGELTLPEFLEVHRMINQDFADMAELVHEQIGLRGMQ